MARQQQSEYVKQTVESNFVQFYSLGEITVSTAIPPITTTPFNPESSTFKFFKWIVRVDTMLIKRKSSQLVAID